MMWRAQPGSTLYSYFRVHLPYSAACLSTGAGIAERIGCQDGQFRVGVLMPVLPNHRCRALLNRHGSELVLPENIFALGERASVEMLQPIAAIPKNLGDPRLPNKLPVYRPAIIHAV